MANYAVLSINHKRKFHGKLTKKPPEKKTGMAESSSWVFHSRAPCVFRLVGKVASSNGKCAHNMCIAAGIHSVLNL